MKPIRTNRSNFTYRGPTPDIMDLPCERTRIEGGGQDGAPITYSVWELTQEERDFVARGGNIKLGILYAQPIPPVSLQIVHGGMPVAESDDEPGRSE